ncbi:methyltransferase domain-containing protein [Herbaspirillum sp. LeCh32-8]|uniref:methyltransferase domain-containing protein n=1 Tax=Herbaspirillum sp. LeCh32-8 TaxID=2821356 RepID=UPI001AE9A20D|nr:methyltransferase domain-containing protein [Herbaspirillum sp. LeCh32-8]MBP0600728.1 methyltransferase domain-containing protein [Herbaspirillum sp. LeCh32-8]
MKLRTMPLAFKYCLGKGIELGAARHNPFDLPDCLFVGTCNGRDYLFPQDLSDYASYKAEQERFGETPLEIDMLGDFQDIAADDGSFDYIVSSHVIEHVPNLFAAYVESSRVLKNGGVFMCLFPKRTAEPTDAVRPLTTLEQMIDAWDRQLDMTKMPLENWRSHYQVFSLQSMLRAINYINCNGLGSWIIECVEETDSKVGNGHTVVLRKFERLAEMRWQTPDQYNGMINQLVENGELSTALSMIKADLSHNFFDATKLYIASMLSIKEGNVLEGVEFLRQSLVINPENERYRREYLRIVGTPFVNPVL